MMALQSRNFVVKIKCHDVQSSYPHRLVPTTWQTSDIRLRLWFRNRPDSRVDLRNLFLSEGSSKSNNRLKSRNTEHSRGQKKTDSQPPTNVEDIWWGSSKGVLGRQKFRSLSRKGKILKLVKLKLRESDPT